MPERGGPSASDSIGPRRSGIMLRHDDPPPTVEGGKAILVGLRLERDGTARLRRHSAPGIPPAGEARLRERLRRSQCGPHVRRALPDGESLVGARRREARLPVSGRNRPDAQRPIGGDALAQRLNGTSRFRAVFRAALDSLGRFVRSPTDPATRFDSSSQNLILSRGSRRRRPEGHTNRLQPREKE